MLGFIIRIMFIASFREKWGIILRCANMENRSLFCFGFVFRFGFSYLKWVRDQFFRNFFCSLSPTMINRKTCATNLERAYIYSILNCWDESVNWVEWIDHFIWHSLLTNSDFITHKWLFSDYRITFVLFVVS